MTRSKRHNGSIWLAVQHTFVSALSLWLDQSFKIHSSCCLKLSCPKTVLWTNEWVRWVGSWKFHGSLPLKSQIQVAVVSHTATGAGHENNPVCQCTHRDWEEIIVRFSHVWLKKHCGNLELSADYSPLLAWHFWMWQSVKLITVGGERHSRRPEKHTT